MVAWPENDDDRIKHGRCAFGNILGAVFLRHYKWTFQKALNEYG